YDSLGNPVQDDSSFSPVVVSHQWGAVGDFALTTKVTPRAGSATPATIGRTFDDLGRLTQATINGRVIANLRHEAQGGRVDFGSGAIAEQPTFDARGIQVGVDVKVSGAVVASQRDALGIDGTVRERQHQFGAGSLRTDFYQLDGAGRVIGENLGMDGL